MALPIGVVGVQHTAPQRMPRPQRITWGGMPEL